jgi:hypothetical protein
MILYFSGIRDKATVAILKEAGVRQALVDPFDLPILLNAGWTDDIILDSGAYREWKGGATLGIPDYLHLARTVPIVQRFVAKDVLGDACQTRANWVEHFRGLDQAIPVWGWGSPHDLLKLYLDEAPVVGIGALVPLIRDRLDEQLSSADRKAWDKQRQQVLDQLAELCSQHPNRFHLFGLCWLKAIRELRHLAASADTSKFLDAARYRYVAFIHERSGVLQQAPAGILNVQHLTRHDLCVMSARAINTYCNG